MNLHTPLSARYYNLPLLKRINLRGWDEQELQFLFPTLYGSNAVTKATKLYYDKFNRTHYSFKNPKK